MSHAPARPLVLALFVVAASAALAAPPPPPTPGAAIEAPAGFDGLTNGFSNQTQFDTDRQIFEEREFDVDGLGPLYNAQACVECHQTPVAGSGSQISELRVGRFDGVRYTDPPGGSLINDRAVDASIQEHAGTRDNVRTFRASLSTLGDGFVEAIADSTLVAIRNAQPPSMRGTLIQVPVLEAPGVARAARFGWKNQHASLLSFSADAYLNEMGITSPLQPSENTANGLSVAAFDAVSDPEETPTSSEPFGPDVHAFARFMRSTKAPPRDEALAATADAQAGRALFANIGCATCHTPDLVTAPPGTVLAGGALVVDGALGGKLIHPYGDFLLHDIGTGDGIVQNGGPATRNQLRTPPLWGLRTRSRLMHDALSATVEDAILRHRGQATPTSQNYTRLPPQERRQILAFLASL